MSTKMEVGGLTDLDRDELEAALAAAGVSPADYQFVEPAMAGAGRAQDFGVTALVFILSPIVVGAISGYLAKSREKNIRNCRVRIWDETGHLRYESEMNDSSGKSAPPPADVLQSIAKAAKIDPEVLAKLIPPSV